MEINFKSFCLLVLPFLGIVNYIHITTQINLHLHPNVVVRLSESINRTFHLHLDVGTLHSFPFSSRIRLP